MNTIFHSQQSYYRIEDENQEYEHDQVSPEIHKDWIITLCDKYQQ